MALREAAMEDDKGQYGDVCASKSAHDRFYFGHKVKDVLRCWDTRRA
jgi:hypothetical protein